MSTTAPSEPLAPSGRQSRPGGARPRPVPRWRRRARPYLLAAPAVVIAIAILYPFGLAIYYSLLNYSAQNPAPSFIGLHNFGAVLGSGAFWSSVRITLIYAFVATGAETVLGIGIALLLNRSSLIGKTLERLLIIPLMIAPVIAALLWSLMFNPQFGIINHVFGLGPSFNWLSQTRALWSAILVDVWVFTPFVALLVLAGIRSLPKEPLEAADVDGAPFHYTFRRLMLPMLWPYILVAVIFRFMDCLKIFDHVYVLTSGGPGTSTTTLQINAYQDSFINFNYSQGDTYMFLLWVIVFIIVRYLVSLLGKAQRRAAGEMS
jgi:multiple sugar transport system permease protein